MAIRLDIHRTSRIWKIGNEKGAYYGQIKQSDLAKLFGSSILSNETADLEKVYEVMKTVINPMFHDKIPEVVSVIQLRLNSVYPGLKKQVQEANTI
jgi:hypothetical protein